MTEKGLSGKLLVLRDEEIALMFWASKVLWKVGIG